jgi:hypothetical protein
MANRRMPRAEDYLRWSVKCASKERKETRGATVAMNWFTEFPRELLAGAIPTTDAPYTAGSGLHRPACPQRTCILSQGDLPDAPIPHALHRYRAPHAPGRGHSST